MKRIFTLLFTFVACTISVFSQWTDVTNNNINYEFKITESYYGGVLADGPFDLNVEPVMKVQLFTTGVGWTDPICYDWNCVGPCSNFGNGFWAWRTNRSFDSTFSVFLEAYESDNSNHCTYQSGDDDVYQGYATLRDNQQEIRVVYPSTDFRPCTWNGWLAANGSQWMFQNASNWDQRWALTWRYTNGDTFSSPLNFGAVSGTKSDINANRAVTSESGTPPLSYTNTANNGSADVFYQFTLNEQSNVTISTSHGETDFDTVIRLFDLGQSQIGYDDDSGTGNSSVLTTSLCSGTYRFMVEGFGSNTGLFKVSVSASPTYPSLSNVAASGVSCAGGNNGSASWSPSGGVGPYTYTFNGDQVSSTSESGLGIGTYQIAIFDACGSSNSQFVDIVNTDSTSPDAVCVNTFEGQVTEGGYLILDPDDIDNGSSDNCEITNMSLVPSSFNDGDGGFHDVVLTVTDSNGNTAQCNSTVYVLVTTDVSEIQDLSEVIIYPNPSSGVVNIDLSSMSISGNGLINVLDHSGRLVHAEQAFSRLMEIDLDHLANGSYILQLVDAERMTSKQLSILR